MSILQLTDLQIYNEALRRLGITTGLATAVDGSDTSKFGKLAYPMYPLTRDEELRQNDWAQVRKRAQLTQAQVTDAACSWTAGSDILTVTSSAALVIGWVIGSALIQGNPPAPAPTGIPTGTLIKTIPGGGVTVQMTNKATANGSGQCVFQVNNLTGFWFAYQVPADSLRLSDVYAVYPASAYLWPFKIVHTLQYPFKQEAGYIYTDIDTSGGNPYAEYVYEPASGTPPFAADFAEMLIYRIAGKLALAATGDLNIKNAMDGNYIALQQRAFGSAAAEEENDDVGEAWWRGDPIMRP